METTHVKMKFKIPFYTVIIAFLSCCAATSDVKIVANGLPKGYEKLNKSIETIISKVEKINIEIYTKLLTEGKEVKFSELKKDYWNPLTYTMMDSLLNSFDNKGIKFGGEIFKVAYVEFTTIYHQVDTGFGRKFRDTRTLDYCHITHNSNYRKHAYFVTDDIYRSYFIEWGELVCKLNDENKMANEDSNMISSISETRINDVAKIVCRIGLLNKNALRIAIK